MQNDFVIHESAAEYHARSRSGEFLSSHLLGDFRRCPMLYHKKITGKIADADSPAYAIGRAAHCLILEGRSAFDAEYIVGEPINPKTGEAYGKTTKAYAEWAAGQTLEVVSPRDFGFILKLQTSVWLHAFAAELLAEGEAEGVVRTEYNGVRCQIRMDWFSTLHGLVDLKTCDDLTWFEADARRFGYAGQLAFYRAVLRMVLGVNVPVHIIAVEKKEPFRTGVWRLSQELLDLVEVENAAAIDRLKICRQTGVWPTGYEEVRFFDTF